MSYTLNLSNGTTLLTLADGTVDAKSTTSLYLVGRNYAGYGQYINQDFIYLLENFRGSESPANPLTGQLWYDSLNRELKAYQGAGLGWKIISGSLVGNTPPQNPVVGDIWFNAGSATFSCWTGSQWLAIGPYSALGGLNTGILGNVVSDGTASHTIGNVVVNNKLMGVLSSDSTAFNPINSSFTTMYPGLNLLAGISVGGNIIAGGNLTIGGAITSTGNISAPAVTATNATFSILSGGSASFSGNVSFTGNVALPTQPTQVFNSNIVPSANLSYNLGSPTIWWNNIYGTSVHAQYADLAERFESDTVYAPGTVVELGGAAEITAVVEELSEDVFGVISTRAAFVMNGQAGGNDTHPPVAVQGRVPVKVIGKIKRGDRLVSAGNGVARAGNKSELTAWNVIGRSLENKNTDGEGIVEAVVKLNS